MIINHKQQFVFICVAKTASTSIRSVLTSNPDPIPPIYHMHLEDVLQQHPKAASYFKFGFVRNPYDRIVSLYHDLKYNTQHSSWAYPIYTYNFEEFVRGIYEGNLPPSEYNWIHMDTQFSYLKQAENIGVDYVGKFENLIPDWLTICEMIGIAPTPLQKCRTSCHDSYQSYYDQETKNMVYQTYQDDFEMFGYTK